MSSSWMMLALVMMLALGMMNTNHNSGVIQLDKAIGHGLDKVVLSTTSKCVPYIGQLFTSNVEAYDYYNKYVGIIKFWNSA